MMGLFFWDFSKDADPKHYFLFFENWQSPFVNTTHFLMRRGFNYGKRSFNQFSPFFLISCLISSVLLFSTPKNSDIYSPKAPKPTDEKANYLQKFIAKDKSTAIHIGRVINPFGFSILRRCTLYLQAYSAGNLIHMMKNSQEILQMVHSETLIFKQKPRP